MTASEYEYELTKLSSVLRGFTRRFTSDRDDSYDLVQDTLLKALAYRGKFKQDINLKGWLFTIMRNTYINNYRKNKQSKTFHDHTKELYFLNAKDEHTFNLPDANYEYRDTWEHIESLQKDLLIPFKMHATGYKYHEISDALAIPIGTVKNRIFHARKEIQKKLSDR
jgi:RNA polymerase sigma factor (sigma-70 family)